MDQGSWEKRKWDMVRQGMERGRAPTLAQFQWALDCVQSRTFAIDTTQGVRCFCLCPMADLFNHDPSAPALLDFCGEKGRFELRTKRAWTEGEEVRISYGSLSNADLLQHYGFVLDDNAHDSEYLSIAHLGAEVRRAGIGSEADRLARLTLLASLSHDTSLALSQVSPHPPIRRPCPLPGQAPNNLRNRRMLPPTRAPSAGAQARRDDERSRAAAKAALAAGNSRARACGLWAVGHACRGRVWTRAACS